MRKFRARQTPYLDLAAQGETVTLSTRRGFFSLIPTQRVPQDAVTPPREETEDEMLMRLDHFTEEDVRAFREGEADMKAGRVTRIKDIHNIWADIL